MSEEKQNKEQETGVAPKKVDKPGGNKPVVVYIMILFIAAFLLMALSFLMHQRSNTEALGQLQNSVTAMQEVQATQEKNIMLQEQLSQAEEELEKTATAYEGQLNALLADLEQQKEEEAALLDLYCLQQAYSNKDYELCLSVIEEMESSGRAALLPTTISGDDTVTPPSERFSQFKDAVSAILTLGD